MMAQRSSSGISGCFGMEAPRDAMTCSTDSVLTEGWPMRRPSISDSVAHPRSERRRELTASTRALSSSSTLPSTSAPSSCQVSKVSDCCDCSPASDAATGLAKPTQLHDVALARRNSGYASSAASISLAVVPAARGKRTSHRTSSSPFGVAQIGNFRCFGSINLVDQPKGCEHVTYCAQPLRRRKVGDRRIVEVLSDRFGKLLLFLVAELVESVQGF